jgi:hypothetical protein
MVPKKQAANVDNKFQQLFHRILMIMFTLQS